MTLNQPPGPPWGYSNPPAVSSPGYPARVAARSSGAAVALELVLGLFGIFGVGNIYAGKMAQGVVIMVSFWVLFWINFFLIFLAVGIVTMPLTWIVYLVLGPIAAARAVEEYNNRIC